jgi:hypothetical protein
MFYSSRQVISLQSVIFISALLFYLFIFFLHSFQHDSLSTWLRYRVVGHPVRFSL